jgi:uncharacterized oxidoreductase
MAEPVICFPEPLQAFVVGVIRAMGAPPDIADIVSIHLVRANLAGHDSHGVLRLMQYVDNADRGDLVPAARPTIVREGEVAAVIDARRGFGHYSTMWAMQWTMEQARRHGVAMAGVRQSNHIGRLAEYSERAAGAGLIGIVTVGAAGPQVGGVVPQGGRSRFLGTNPWSVAVPGAARDFVFDAATSTWPEGKVRFARAKRAELPRGILRDKAGQPSLNPEDYYAGGALQPLGGEVAGHKGYGFALASALLGGLAAIDDDEPTLAGVALPLRDRAAGRMAGVFVQVIDPTLFGDTARYRTLVDETLATAKLVPPAPGCDEVLVAGEPEARSSARRSRDGIQLPTATWADLTAVSERFAIPLPEHRV